jgi:hypothetical protein
MQIKPKNKIVDSRLTLVYDSHNRIRRLAGEIVDKEEKNGV